MQQQISQSDPIGGQAMSQQMVLCPVRFVYETQVLVQPGEQIQPNQTFFINPQNPPPWMQNRQQPNPVVYVQQLPNNIVPQVQQHMDQNQLYLQQNYANFQLQQQMLAQNEMRPMQIANIVPNMVQQNVPNDRIQNGQMQNNNMIQNHQMSIANTRQVSNQPMNQVDVQRQVFMNMRPQISHQVNITRPVMAINQIQNMQTLANMQNVQIQQPNVGQMYQNIGQRPPNSQNVNTVRPQAPNNVINVQPVAKVREIAPSEANKINTAVGGTVPVRNFSQNYNCRPIQPRRRYGQNNSTLANAITKAQNQHIPVQSLPHGYNGDKGLNSQISQTSQVSQNSHTSQNSHNSQQTVSNAATNTNFINPNLNRKRKSESPDELQKKIAVQPNLIPQQGITVTKLCNEIGTNTSPVHKPTNLNNSNNINNMNQNNINNLNANSINNMNANNINNLNAHNAAFQMNTPMMVVENAPQIENAVKKLPEQNVVLPSLSEKEKLIRNTVYTQARGRLLQDKISETLLPQEAAPESMHISVNIVNNEVQIEITPEKTEKVTVQTETQVEKAVVTDLPKPVVLPEKVEVENKTQEVKAPEQNKVVEENSVNSETKSDEIVSEKVALNKDKDFILTHVVDGYVIQESNFAFPIRKPLKEKTLFTNHKEAESTDALKECMKEEMKSDVDIPLLPFHYLMLNCDKKGEKERESGDRSNPFDKLQQTTVKNWTVDDLSQHLLKFDWKDTVSVLQDHEIDGESLFLVSKTQLLNIGVTEEHTNTIWEFVRS